MHDATFAFHIISYFSAAFSTVSFSFLALGWHHGHRASLKDATLCSHFRKAVLLDLGISGVNFTVLK